MACAPPSAPINKECSHAVRERGVTACSWQDRQLAGRKGQLYRLPNPFSRGAPRNNFRGSQKCNCIREGERKPGVSRRPAISFLSFFIRCLLHCSAFLPPRLFVPPIVSRIFFFPTFFVCLLVKNRPTEYFALHSLSLSLSTEKNSFLARMTQQRNFVQQNRISWMGRGSRNRRAHEKIFFNCRKTIAGWMEDGHPRPRGSDFERFPIFLTRARRKGDAAGEIAREYIYIAERKEDARGKGWFARSSQAIHSEYVSISSLYSWL